MHVREQLTLIYMNLKSQGVKNITEQTSHIKFYLKNCFNPKINLPI